MKNKILFWIMGVIFLSMGTYAVQQINMFDSSNNNDIRFDTGGDSWLNGGNLGIGTTAPTQALNIIGASNITGDMFLSISGLGSCSGKLITSADGNITCGTDATGGGGGGGGWQNLTITSVTLDNNTALVGIGTQNPIGILQVDGTGDIIFNQTGNVGIGTTAPANTLNVIGATNITGDLFLSINSLASCDGKLITSADGNITC